MMDTQAKLIAAQRLIKVVTGEPYGDDETVSDVGVGYSEPGYHDEETVWALGDWNNKSRYVDGQRIETSNVPGRLFDALERIGVEGEWLDEWTRCDHCQRIVRTSGDSYMWKPFYVILTDGETLCGTCALDPDWSDEVMEPYINDSGRVITWCDESYLESLGWQRYNPDEYQSGWHEGMDDKPAAIAERINETMPNHDYVFWLDEASQFYIGFSAFTRAKQSESEE